MMSNFLLFQDENISTVGSCSSLEDGYTLTIKVNCAGISGKQLAELAKVSIRTVEDWRRKNQGPTYQKLSNGEIRYPLDSVAEFITKYRGCTLISECEHEK